MRILFVALIAIFVFSSCQHEIDDVLPDPDPTDPTNITDTSVIARVTKICYDCGMPGGDSTIHLFRNNTRSGVKGYIVYTKGYSNNFLNSSDSSTTRFTYNNSGHLTTIDNNYFYGGGISDAFKWEFIRNNNLITRIKYTESGYLLMNRAINYRSSHDSLYITMKARHEAIVIDSTNFTIVTDTGCNKLFSIYAEGVFNDFSGGAYNSRDWGTFKYLGDNVVEQTYFRLDTVTGTASDFHGKDSAVLKYTRIPTAGDFWNTLEKKMLGKELRILSTFADSTEIIFENLFHFANEYLPIMLENARQPVS